MMHIFKTNPEKAAARVAINGVMLASVFVMLAVVFISLENFDTVAVGEMILSIPFLFISSLAYCKIGYWKETRLWESLGYFTNTIGNIFLINSIGIISARLSDGFAYTYFAITIALFLLYSTINMYHTREYSNKIFKFIFTFLLILFGGIVPILLK